MKTAMEKKETGLMRQIGYLSFVVVFLSLFCCMGLRYLRFLVTMMKILLFLPQWKK